MGSGDTYNVPRPALAMGESPRRTNVLLALLFAGLVIELARTLANALFARYVISPDFGPFASGPPTEALYFASSVITFAFSPCLLFVAYYFIGKRVDLAEDWEAPALALFASGLLVGVLAVFVSIAAYSSDFQGYVSALEAQFASGWNWGEISLSALGEGFYLVFIGIAAIYIGDRRREAQGAEGPEATSPGCQVGSDFESRSTALS